jgi:hypothetical protein
VEPGDQTAEEELLQWTKQCGRWVTRVTERGDSYQLSKGGFARSKGPGRGFILLVFARANIQCGIMLHNHFQFLRHQRVL